MLKSTLKISKQLSVFLFFALFSFAAFAQNTVSGKVTDANGAGVEGVTVNVKGTKTSVKTSAQGLFTINAAPNATLVFTSVGYAPVQMPVNGRGQLTVSMGQANTRLSEVVVIGYGSVRKRDLTGSVAQVTSKDFNKGEITTADQLISGKVAGVSVISNGGTPGGGSTIRIRGGASLNASNNPLIVIDGVPVDVDGGVKGAPSFLSTINPNDIESFSILKDASATAIYGSRASNGVILITTKKGRKGKTTFTFNSNLSVSKLIKEVDVLSAAQLTNLTKTNPSGANFVQYLGTANTNWQDQIYHTAIGSDNNLSATGAWGNMPYRASFGFLDQDGIERTSNLKRFSGSLNLSPTFFNDHLKVNVNLKGTTANSSYPDGGVIGNAISFNPTQPVYSGNNNYGGYYQYLDPTSITGLKNGSPLNPVGLLNQNSNTAISQRAIGNALIDYKFNFLPDLHATLNLGFDVSSGTEKFSTSDSAANSYKYSNSNNAKDTTKHYGSYHTEKATTANTLLEFYLSYGKDLKSIDSRVDLVAGYSFQDFLQTFINTNSYDAKGDTIYVPTYPNDKPEYALLSYYARLNYALKGKYILTGSIRSDASSRFPTNNRYAVFPSAAVAWRIKEESFLKNSKTFSDLKLRIGYGITGQQDGLPNYPSVINYFSTNVNSQYQLGNSFYTGYTLAGYNTQIKWEQTATSNIGLDYGLFHNRVTGSVDYYYKKTTDLINNVNLASGTNPANIFIANVGSMENTGVEGSINLQAIRKHNMSLDFGFNITYNKNKITKLTFNPDPTSPGALYNPTSGISLPGTGNLLFINALNEARGSFYVYQQVYDANGKPIEDLFVDRNRDGVIDDKDRYAYKNADPDVFMGFNTNFSYKKWNAGFSMRASLGNYMYNNNAANNGRTSTIFITNGGGVLRNGSTDVLYTNFKGSSDKFFLSDYYVQNASFLKMDYITVGYLVGKVINNKASLRLNANVQNVFTITKYTGIDPEIPIGVDNTLYPRPRIYSLGVNLDF